MWPFPDRELDNHPGRERDVAIPIPCNNGQITLHVGAAESDPLEIDIGSQWRVAYTLELDGMSRTETLGYASTYLDAVGAVRSYLSTIRSVRSERDQLDALDVKSRLDALAPPRSDPVITPL